LFLLFAACVIDTSGKLPTLSLTLAANLPPVQQYLPAVLVAKFAAGVKFATVGGS
jgi:hypothetical protein